MLTVNFIMKKSSCGITFVFKAYKAADDLYKKAKASPDAKFECEDDYETKGYIDMSEVAAVTLSEYEKDMEKNCDMQIIQRKSELKMMNKAKNDAGLKLLDSAANSVGPQC